MALGVFFLAFFLDAFLVFLVVVSVESDSVSSAAIKNKAGFFFFFGDDGGAVVVADLFSVVSV